MRNAKIMGERGYQLFLEAADISSPADEKRKEAFEICEFAMKEQLIDGCIGVIWDDEGKMTRRQGLEGACLVAPLAIRYMLTKEHVYQIAAVRGFAYYEREFRTMYEKHCEKNEKELAFGKEALVRAAHLMYKATGFEQYLKFAEEWEAQDL